MEERNQTVIRTIRYQDPEWKDDCLRIRITVFIDEQKFDMADEIDSYEEESIHLLAYQNGLAIGVARFVPRLHKVGRLAILQEARGTGVGRDLMLAIEPLAQKEGLTYLAVSSQMHARPFYAKIGYVEEGQVYKEDGADHVLMTKRL